MTRPDHIDPDSVELLVPSNPKFLAVVRAVLRETAEKQGWDPKELRAVTLAVDEACSNIMRHSYKGQTDRPIWVKVRTLDDEIRIELRDLGEKVDPSRLRPRDLEDVRPGGLGIHLIRSLMDEVTYDLSEPEGNRLILVRKKSRQHEPED